MTKNELIDAYVRGDVDRRGFIRKLTAMGVSAAAATAYAGGFARDAAAAPARNGAGFVARAQDGDEEYGTALAAENIEEAIIAFTSRSEDLVEKLEQIADRTKGNGPKVEHVATIKAQIVEQRKAMLARFKDKHGLTETSSGAKAFRGAYNQNASVEQQLLDVADEMNVQAGIAAGLIPALQNAEDRALMTSIGLVTARQAAVLSLAVDGDPVPATFEAAVLPDEVEEVS